MKMIKVSLKLLKDIYFLLTSSSKIDWEDDVTSRLDRAIEKWSKKEQKVERNNGGGFACGDGGIQRKWKQHVK